MENRSFEPEAEVWVFSMPVRVKESITAQFHILNKEINATL